MDVLSLRADRVGIGRGTGWVVGRASYREDVNERSSLLCHKFLKPPKMPMLIFQRRGLGGRRKEGCRLRCEEGELQTGPSIGDVGCLP
jgi:hypothetical protein